MSHFKTLSLYWLLTCFSLPLFAQTDSLLILPPLKDTTASPFTLEANIDGYYYYSSLQRDSYNAMVLKQNEPDLGFLSVALSCDYKKMGGMLQMAIGPRANQFYGLDDAAFLKYFRQVYFYYKPIEALKLNIGTATSAFGYEYDDPHLNPNYSTSYINSTVPATMTGFWSEYELGGNFSLTAGIYNDIDRKIDDTKGVHLGGTIAYISEPISAWLSYLNGKQADGRLHLIDFLADFKISESNAIGLEWNRTLYNNTTTGDVYFSAINLYLMHHFTEKLSTNLRFEYFSDPVGFYFGAEDNQVYDITLTGKWKWKWFVLMPELRQDFVSKAVFENKDGQAVKKSFAAMLGISIVY